MASVFPSPVQQLAERLHAIEQALRRAPRHQHSGAGRPDHITLLVKIMVARFVSGFHSLRFEIR